jgi:hypothetical protein
MKETLLQKLLIFIISMLIWYTILAFITLEPSIFNWYWAIRLIYVLIFLVIINNILR